MYAKRKEKFLYKRYYQSLEHLNKRAMIIRDWVERHNKVNTANRYQQSYPHDKKGYLSRTGVQKNTSSRTTKKALGS